MKLNETIGKTGFYVLILTLALIASQAVLGDDLEIVPLDNFELSGQSGGPFTPSFKEYQLTNIGPDSLWWGAYKTVDWLDIDVNDGALDPCESTMVTVSLNTAAESLAGGVYTDTLIFNDITNDEQQTRGVILSIGSGWINPGSFDVNIVEGCTSTETLTIGNDGIEDLDFMIRTHQVGSCWCFNGTRGRNTSCTNRPRLYGSRRNAL